MVGTATLAIYLFVSAPPPLREESSDQRTIPVQTLLEICDHENAIVRKMYTKEIVGPGRAAGLAFDEGWRDDDVQAGPLPALFVRETARSLERSPIRLSLFLGSLYPIQEANGFSGVQLAKFKRMLVDREPRHFFVEDTALHTAMFPDPAVTQACVSCHNEHEDSPKNDWELGDVMGAVTWAYPKEQVSLEEAMQAVSALRQAFRDVYSAYVKEARAFDSPPSIGELWPAEGYAIPSADTFMREAAERASAGTMERLLEAS